MLRNPTQADKPAAAATGAPNRSSYSSAESAVSPGALPTEAEVRATDLEVDTAVPSEEVGVGDRERRIREAAYAAYLRRGGQPGDPAQDWLDAEREVDAKGDGGGPPRE